MATTDRIDGLVTALAIKAPVKAATTASITLSAAQTIDGVSIVAGDRVLVKNQSTATENGIYLCQTGAWTRAKDFDGNRDIVSGTFVYVQQGTLAADTYWRQTTTGTGSSGNLVIGTDSPAFTQTSLNNIQDATNILGIAAFL